MQISYFFSLQDQFNVLTSYINYTANWAEQRQTAEVTSMITAAKKKHQVRSAISIMPIKITLKNWSLVWHCWKDTRNNFT